MNTNIAWIDGSTINVDNPRVGLALKAEATKRRAVADPFTAKAWDRVLRELEPCIDPTIAYDVCVPDA